MLRGFFFFVNLPRIHIKMCDFTVFYIFVYILNQCSILNNLNPLAICKFCTVAEITIMLLHVSAWIVDDVAVHRADKYLGMTELLKELNTHLTWNFAETCSFPYTYYLVK